MSADVEKERQKEGKRHAHTLIYKHTNRGERRMHEKRKESHREIKCIISMCARQCICVSVCASVFVCVCLCVCVCVWFHLNSNLAA